MRKNSAEQDLRVLFLVLSGLAFFGAIIELLFVGHYESAIQIIPFVLSSLGVVMVFISLKKSSVRVIHTLRYVSVFIALGGIFGMYEHFSNNVAFELEVHPEYTFGTAIWEAFGGATPLMAPGILTFAALLAIASTWRHPTLSEDGT